MAEKLKLILRPIPWSLLLKAAAFGVGWLILPFWVFVVLAALLYFLPVFQVLKLLFPFVLTLILAYLVPPSLWAGLFLSALFFFILGVKDLVLIDRAAALSSKDQGIGLKINFNFSAIFEFSTNNFIGQGIQN